MSRHASLPRGVSTARRCRLATALPVRGSDPAAEQHRPHTRTHTHAPCFPHFQLFTPAARTPLSRTYRAHPYIPPLREPRSQGRYDRAILSPQPKCFGPNKISPRLISGKLWDCGSATRFRHMPVNCSLAFICRVDTLCGFQRLPVSESSVCCEMPRTTRCPGPPRTPVAVHTTAIILSPQPKCFGPNTKVPRD